jgi:uncharacterized protein YjbJ (UPF0337 family)
MASAGQGQGLVQPGERRDQAIDPGDRQDGRSFVSLVPAGGSDWHSLGRLCMRGSPSAPTEPTAFQTMTAQRRVIWTWPVAFVPSIAG